MINRRLIRIKVFKVLFSAISSGEESFTKAERELMLSFEKSLELYHFILTLPLTISYLAQEKIEVGLKKFQPTQQEREPSYNFVKNSLVELLENDSQLREFCSKRGLNWMEHLPLVKKIFKNVGESSYYQEYLSIEEPSFKDDVTVICSLFEEELEDNEELEEMLEDKSLYWTDELAYVINIITKTLYSLKEGESIEHPKLFLKEEDGEFAKRLLNYSMLKQGDYIELISQFLLNWESDRLASVDTLLIVMGVVEAVFFPNIPLKVTINEYVELSKYYSTPNSRLFVNGILDKILLTLQESGEIKKSGRGLVG